MKAPIVAIKHYVQTTLSSQAAATKTAVSLVKGVTIANTDLPNEVVEGSVVKAVYIEMWLASNDASGSSMTVNVEKISNTGATVAMTYANSIALHSYQNKKNIFYCSEGITGDDEHPIPFIRMWLKLPKGKQRFGFGDELVLNISAISSTLSWCGMTTYKSYS